ncbi:MULTISPECIES: ABC transporter permease [unclassified Modestobacter]
MGSRLLYGIPVLLVVTFGAVALAEFIPGSPGQAILGDQATPERVAALNERYGYDRPVAERYVDWLGSALQGDLGTTLFTNEPVSEVVLRRLAVTAELALLAMLMALVASVVLALVAVRQVGGWLDRTLDGLSSALLCIPSFVSVVLVSLVFVVWLGAFPATGWVPPTDDLAQNLEYAFLPALSLALFEAAFFYRVIRADLGGTLREDFVLVARTKGLSKRYVLTRHALRPSLSSLVTVMGLSLGRLLGGAAIVEYFFSVPGLGYEAIAAVSIKDMNMIQAIVAISVVAYVLIFILVDLAYSRIDPRVSVR